MTELKDVKGIGPKALSLLNKIGIYTIDDLVTHYPFRYEVLERGSLAETEDGERIVIDGKVESMPLLMRFKAGLNKMNFRLVTASGVVGVSIFNRAFLKTQLTVGTGITVIGKFDKTKNVITASDIKMGTLMNKTRIEPVYHCTSGLTNKNLATYINMTLLMYGKEIEDYIPASYMKKYDFVNKKTALNIIHNPSTMEKLKEVTIRLKYEELFTFMFKINYLKLENKKKNNGLVRNIDMAKIEKFVSSLPFELTGDQLQAVKEITDDLASPNRMNRLLQGDVGSGKTIVAFIGMLANYYSGYQSALMVPTEILANQHYNNMKNLFGDLVNVELLTGSTSKKDKTRIYEGLKDGSIDMVVGTHALIQDDVVYYNLGLVVTDEQHRFGVNQRDNLKNKGLTPDVLYMSATPIPRTYALTIYGDMDISTIKTMPKGRKPVVTIVKEEDEIKDVLYLIKDNLDLNHQIYVVAPLIDGENNDSVKKLLRQYKLAFKNYKIGMLHGKLRPSEKEEVMQKFINGEIDILISTTVIEVGVDVKNATMIVIHNANLFGLSTLHQLRGRVGRNSYDNYCVLIGNKDNERLKIMETTCDGF